MRSWGGGTAASSRLRVEEFTDNDQLVGRAELPGVDPDKDVSVTVDDDILTIKAERSSQTSDKTDSGYRSEFQCGSFPRQLRMPPGTQADQIVAIYKDGVLEIRLRRPATGERMKSIPVSRG